MSIAYTAPSNLTAGAPSSAHAAFSWDPSELLGTIASLLHFESSETLDEAGIATWTRETEGFNVANNVTYNGPTTGTPYFFAQNSEGRPQLSPEPATTDGTNSVVMVNNGALGGNRADLLSSHVSGFNPNTDWTIECFVAKADIDNFGNTTPTIWSMADTDVNGLAGKGLQLFRNGFGGNIVLVAFGAGTSSDSIDSGLPLPTGVWTHVAVSKRGDEYQLFVDGALTGSMVFDIDHDDAVNLCLGFPRYYQDAGQPGLRLIGWLDEFRYVRGHTVYWDDDFMPPAHDLSQYAQGYVIYRDGVELTTVDDVLNFVDEDVVPGNEYTYTVAAWDGLSIVSPFSDPIIIGVIGIRNIPLTEFNDEEVFTGYFGGKLKGTTVACVGDNANKVKPC